MSQCFGSFHSCTMYERMFMMTYCATGVRSTVEKRASHSHNLCLHFSYTRKDIWVKWVAPSKISIYLSAEGRFAYTPNIYINTGVETKRHTKKKRTESCLLLTAARTKLFQVQPSLLVLGMSRNVNKDANLHQETGQRLITPVHCTGNTPFLPLHLICNSTSCH